MATKKGGKKGTKSSKGGKKASGKKAAKSGSKKSSAKSSKKGASKKGAASAGKKGAGKKGAGKKGGSKKGGGKKIGGLRKVAGDVLSAAMTGALKGAVVEAIPPIEKAAGVTEADKKGQPGNK